VAPVLERGGEGGAGLKGWRRAL